MSDEVMDELGPIDFVVIEFPAGKANFSGAMAEKLKALVEAGIVRVLDLLIITKDDDGAVDAFELHDFDNEDADALRELGGEFTELLSEEDVGHIAAVRHSGGQLVASGRIPTQAILAAVEANEDAAQTEGA
jgi:hypothetical protein